MQKKMIGSTLVAAAFLYAWVQALLFFQQNTFFARRHRHILYIVFVILGICILFCFVSQMLYLYKQQQKLKKAEQKAKEKEKQQEERALKAAAELLRGEEVREELLFEDSETPPAP